jgi:hypothetical protein
VTTVIAAPPDLYEEFRRDFDGRIEHVGFFLADFDQMLRSLLLTEWRVIPPDGYEFQSDFHVSLKDEVRAEIIKWAWDAGASLVEVHSHGGKYPASFSPSDLWGLEEWVPHLWWRLRERPYAAIVTASETLDGLAWIDDPEAAEQVDRLEIGDASIPATRLTLEHRSERSF